MTCFNAMPFLPAAVESIRAQTFTDWELIVVNDGSVDESSSYLDPIAEQDSRIRVINQTNQGQQVAADVAISAAQGEWIARMDADDVADPMRLEHQMRFLAENPEVGLVGGQIRRLGSQRSGLASNFPADHESIVDALLKNQHVMCNPTVIFRKSLYHQVGGYWEHNIAEDWDLFLRFAEVSRLANVEPIVLSYRFHTGSINGRRIVEAQLFNEYAAELAIRRERKEPAIPFEQFVREHRSSRWPTSWLFYADSQAIGQYREAIAEIYNGRPLLGYARLGLSVAMSPTRAIRRIGNMLAR